MVGFDRLSGTGARRGGGGRWWRTVVAVTLTSGGLGTLALAAATPAGALIAPTSVVTTSSANPNAYDTSVTLTATVTGSTTTPGGTVKFTAKVGTVTTTICAAAPVTGTGTVSTATCPYDPTPATSSGQSASIGAAYSGDTTYSAKTATAYTQLELGSNALSTFAFTSSANPVASATAVTVTATLAGPDGTPTGTVVFSDDGTPVTCTGDLTTAVKIANGAAKCKETPATSGAHTITATYSGDVNYAAAPSPVPFTQLVNGTVAPTSVVTSSSANPNAYDTAVTLTATVTGSTTTPGGTVKFTARVGTVTTTICAAAPVTGTGTVSTATCPYDPTPTGALGQAARIGAAYSGDGTYSAKAAASFTQTELGSDTVTTFSLSPSPTSMAPAHTTTITATVAGPDGAATGTVTFLDAGQPITCTGATSTAVKIANGAARCKDLMTISGTHVITATYSGSTTYAAATTPTPADVVVTGTSVPGNPTAASATAIDWVAATVTFDAPALDGNEPISSYTVTATDLTTPANGGQTEQGTGSPLTVTGLTGNDTYVFTVTATNSVGTSAPSARSNAIVAIPPVPPGAPTGASAIPFDGSAQVSFTTPASDGGEPITSYTVTATDETTPANGGQTYSGAQSPLPVYNLVNGDSYTFTVTATNSAGTGDPSAPSNAVVPEASYGYTIPVGADPQAVASNGTDVWVTNTGAGTVTEIDAATSLQVRTIGGFDAPNAVAADANYVWVADVGNDTVTQLSAATGAVVNTLSVGGYPDAVSDDGTHVWVGGLDGTVTEIDATTGAVVTTINGGFGSIVGISSDGTDVWVSPESGGTVYEISCATAEVVNTIATPATLGVDIASNGTTVWQANQFDNTVTEIDAATGQVLNTLTGFSEPWGVAVSGGDVFITNSSVGTVEEIDAATAEPVATFDTGSAPLGIAADGTDAWTANAASDTVSRLSFGPPAAPLVGTASIAGITSGLVNFTQSNNGTANATSYTVTATDVTDPSHGGQSATGATSPIVVDGLTTGDTYYFTVTATNPNGTGPPSDGSNSIVPGPPYDQTILDAGGNINGGTISSDGTHVWSVGQYDTVAELDENGTMVRTIQLGTNFFANALSSNGTDVWVTALNFNSFMYNVIEIDASTGAVVNTFSGFPSGSLDGVYANSTFVWVTQPATNSVYELSASTGAVITSFVTGNGAYSIAGCGDAVWVANNGYNTYPPAQGSVTEINALTGAEGNTIDVATPYAISADCTDVWVADNDTSGHGTNGITEIDAATDSVVQFIPGLAAPTAIASNGTDVWVGDTSTTPETVTEYNETTGDVVYSIPLAGTAVFSMWADPYGVWIGYNNSTYLTELFL